jgi:hypothetical protein
MSLIFYPPSSPPLMARQTCGWESRTSAGGGRRESPGEIGISAISATDLVIAEDRPLPEGLAQLALAIWADEKRWRPKHWSPAGVCKEGHDADPLVVKVGTHTPQHCSVLSRAKSHHRASSEYLRTV